MPDRIDLSVVVPVYRNAGTLRALHRRLDAALGGAGLAFEALYVDDASPDHSAAVLAELAAGDRRAAALLLAANGGQNRAVLAGVVHARGPWIVAMDADLQDPPEAIPALLDAARGGYDAVFAGRRGEYESRGRLWTSRIFKRVIGLLSGVPPDAGLFVAFNRRTAEGLLAMDARRPYVVAMIGRTGARSTSVPVVRERRREGSSSYTSGMRLAVGAAALWSALAGRPGRRSGLRGTARGSTVRAMIGARWERAGAEAGRRLEERGP
jgi:polyisoprenyl-phosphate glycosyltransferase